MRSSSKRFHFLTGFLAATVGVGPAAAALLPAPITHAATTIAVASVVSSAAPAAAQSDVSTYLAMHEDIADAVFADVNEASTAFELNQLPNNSGPFAASSYFGTSCTLIAMHIVDLDLETNDPGLHAAGMDARLIIGTLQGPAGFVRVSGLAIDTGSVTTDTEVLFTPSSILDDPTFSIFREAQRNSTRRFFPSQAMASVVGPPVIAADEAAIAFSDDLGTTYLTGDSNSSTLLAPENVEACIAAAYANFDIDVNAANASAAVCATAATAVWASCMASCIASTIWIPVFGGPATVICSVACLAAQAIGYAACAANLSIALDAANARLQAALAACGVIILEQ